LHEIDESWKTRNFDFIPFLHIRESQKEICATSDISEISKISHERLTVSNFEENANSI